MSNIHCYKCGAILTDGCDACPYCGAPAPLSADELKRTSTIHSATIITPAQTPPPPPPPLPHPVGNEAVTRRLSLADIAGEATPKAPVPVLNKPGGSRKRKRAGKGNDNGNWLVLILLCVVAAVVGTVLYIVTSSNVETDEEMYAISYIPVRSEPLDIENGNIVDHIIFAEPVEVTEYHGKWSAVEIESDNGEDIIGYVPTEWLLNTHDLALLRGIFADRGALAALQNPIHRRALLNYYIYNGLTGRIDPDARRAGVSEPESGRQWQLCGNRYRGQYERVFVGHVTDPSSRHADVAVMLNNLRNGQNKVVYFTFNDDGTPVFRSEQPAQGKTRIVSVQLDENAQDGLYIEME